MSVFVHYDRAGTIHSFVIANAPEGGGMMLTPKPGMLVAEVVDLQPQPDPGGHAGLREIAKGHVVAPPHGRVTLVKKR